MKRSINLIITVVAAVGLLWIGSILNSHLKDYWQDLILQCGIAIIVAVSLNIVNGLTGQFAIGHGGFMAVGAYTGASVTYMALAKFTHNTEPNILWMLLAMGAGGLVAALFGYVVGVPSLRLRGDYLAIVTLGFGEIIRVLLENTSDLSALLNKIFDFGCRVSGAGCRGGIDLNYMGGATGFQNIPAITKFPILFGTALVVIWLSRNLKFSSHGLAFMSIREDEIAADAMGVNTTRIKVTAFTLSAFFAGVGGVLFAHAKFIKPDVFGFILSMNYVVMIVLGGTGSITGATLAAVVLTLLTELLKPIKDKINFSDEYLQVIYALILVLMMILRPAGVFGKGELNLKRLLRLFGKREEIEGKREEGETSDSSELSADTRHPTPPTSRMADTRLAEHPTPITLDLAHLTKQFGGLTAVGDVNIELKNGELVGLIGPNGAGKTTVFNLLTGVYEPTEGSMTFLGDQIAGERLYTNRTRILLLAWDTFLITLGGYLIGVVLSTALLPSATTPELIRIQGAIQWLTTFVCMIGFLATSAKRRRVKPGMKPFQFAKRGISRTFQNIRLFGELTVLENVRIGSYLRRRTGIFDALLQTGRLKREEAEGIDKARELLKRFNLLRVQNELAKNLPYGDQRRLEIVRALATEPKLLLLDEPAAGMNPKEKVALMDLIRQIRDDFNLTILLIEHDMKLVMGICERIYVLDYGKIIAEGLPQEIRTNPKVIAAYLGVETEEPVEAALPTTLKQQMDAEGDG